MLCRNTSIYPVCGNLDRCHQYPQTWAVWQEALSCQSAKVVSRHSRSFLSQLQPYLASAHELVIPHAYLPLIDALPQYVILLESRDTQISPKQNRVITVIFNKLFTMWRDSSETRKLRQIRPCLMNVTWVTTSTWPRGTNSRLSMTKTWCLTSLLKGP